MQTLREKIIDLLMSSERPLTVNEIGEMLGVPREQRKLLYEELLHAAKTLKRKSGGAYQLVYEPPRCAACGYVFRELKRVRRPSRCPRCKSERILPPRFWIVET